MELQNRRRLNLLRFLSDSRTLHIKTPIGSVPVGVACFYNQKYSPTAIKSSVGEAPSCFMDRSLL